MLLQMAKLCGLGPVVAVVGSSHKRHLCEDLGADAVIDKSSEPLWERAKELSPAGYIAIFDANGVSTLRDSYAALAQCGRLIVYGFHSNLPLGSSFLSPFTWIKMATDMVFRMPKFDSMKMVLESKAVLGFNLSFFADQHDMIDAYMNQILTWITESKVRVAHVNVFSMESIHEAHEHIQSGRSVGKIVVRTAPGSEPFDAAQASMGSSTLEEKES